MKQTRAFFNRFSIGVTALWLLLFALLPNIGLLVVTVLTRGEQDFVLPQFTLDNYAYFFTSAEALQSLLFTLAEDWDEELLLPVVQHAQKLCRE